MKIINTTIFSDASFCPQTKASGWGFFIKNSYIDKIETGAGCFNRNIDNIQEAEFLAMTYGLIVAIRKNMLIKGDKVQFQLDNKWCLSVLYTFTQKTSHTLNNSEDLKCSRVKKLKKLQVSGLSDNIQQCLRIIKKLQQKFNLSFVVTHIKAHKNKKFKLERNYYNKYCDNMAKKQMKIKREFLLDN